MFTILFTAPTLALLQQPIAGLMSDLQKGKKLIKKFTSKDGLPDNIVRCLFNATETSLWFGMQDAGIASASTGFEMYDHTADWKAAR